MDQPLLPPHAMDERFAELRAERDAAYTERNRLVAFLALMFPSVRTQTAIEGWDPEWHNCVYVDTPAGQMSWHYHDNDAYLFSHIWEGSAEWDGHATPEKYERLRQLINTLSNEPHLFVLSYFAQQRGAWMNWELATFGEEISYNVEERGLRFLEEALELAQALGVRRSQVDELAGAVYAEPPGDAHEEAKDVLSTYHILCGMIGAEPEAGMDQLLVDCQQRAVYIRVKWDNKVVASTLAHLQQSPEAAPSCPTTKSRPYQV